MKHLVHTRYHSHDWERLTELGYITATVEENPMDQTQTAVMVSQWNTLESNARINRVLYGRVK